MPNTKEPIHKLSTEELEKLVTQGDKITQTQEEKTKAARAAQVEIGNRAISKLQDVAGRNKYFELSANVNTFFDKKKTTGEDDCPMDLKIFRIAFDKTGRKGAIPTTEDIELILQKGLEEFCPGSFVISGVSVSDFHKNRINTNNLKEAMKKIGQSIGLLWKNLQSDVNIKYNIRTHIKPGLHLPKLENKEEN